MENALATNKNGIEQFRNIGNLKFTRIFGEYSQISLVLQIQNKKVILGEDEAKEFVNCIEKMIYDELSYEELERKCYRLENKCDDLEGALMQYIDR